MKTNILSLILIPLLTYFSLSPKAQAVSPSPDGGYGPPDYGTGNTAEGEGALLNLGSGTFNTATGFRTLFSTTTGSFNTALGAGALLFNSGDANTATGAGALLHNTTGTHNTAMGESALFSNTTGDFNTGVGDGALHRNTTGSGNAALGVDVLVSNTTGDHNTAVGESSLNSNETGSGNTAIGFNSGFAVTDANNVICIGARLPGANVNNSCYIGSIFGQTSPGGAAVFIDSNNKLGTSTSSKRFKDDIKPMNDASEPLFSLKPVTFHYKHDIDPNCEAQFGLVAEDVEAINPDLVVRDREGKAYSVRYDQVNAMLLNEFLKEHRRVRELEATVAQQRKDSEATAERQQKQIDALTAGLQKVSAQLELSKPAPQTVLNNH